MGARRAVPLPVAAAFHCALMQPAQDRLAPDLAALRSGTRVPLVNNVDAAVVTAGADCREGLVRQVSGPVRWRANRSSGWSPRASTRSSSWARAPSCAGS